MSSPCSLGEDHVGIVNLDDTMSELPVVGEGGMSGRNVQRKLGTTRGSLRRSRTAKTSRISRRAVKSRCAHEWGGWGRLSDDGSRQHNSSKSEDPWGSGNPTSWWCTIELTTRHSAGLALDHEVHEGWRQTGGHGVYVGSRLKRPGHPGRHHLKCQPSSRIEENPPYGMIGGIEETSASYEARSAPRSYPTGAGDRLRRPGGEEKSLSLPRPSASPKDIQLRSLQSVQFGGLRLQIVRVGMQRRELSPGRPAVNSVGWNDSA